MRRAVSLLPGGMIFLRSSAFRFSKVYLKGVSVQDLRDGRRGIRSTAGVSFLVARVPPRNVLSRSEKDLPLLLRICHSRPHFRIFNRTRSYKGRDGKNTFARFCGISRFGRLEGGG